ncbi:DUF1028 domain-containing protein [Halanaerobium sp. Z-7514]|uniref:DUF1028 domain-containing protein n=1 Tax=Halanaerobium polyolivorans TaxID=2886943 RepID=A0AAW4WTV9_9FIRM|nr:DUF1028 domain-containing protein [Halanaerobium polyolivorans]MCC3144538.1 DUF1028 domain-containing protein [Halanaerobium polyolivorans]
MADNNLIATFSIIAYDPVSEELGVAVQSKFLAVGSMVPWARAGVGAVATQAWGNTSFGPRALDLLEKGKSPQEAVNILIEADQGAEFRQLAVINAEGKAAAYTGSNCSDWAGEIIAENYSVQGNILVNEKTLQAMADSFENSKGPLADRLVKSLRAGQFAGGDKRGRQAAALFVVKEGRGIGGFDDRYIDLRVDDHPRPIEELARLLKLFYQQRDN